MVSECVRPVVASKKAKSLFRLIVEDGGPGFCQFAITTACNARCGFCGFARDQRPGEARKHVALQDAVEAVRILHTQGVRYLEIDGGEPLLHPSVEEIVREASALKMNVLLVTNGSLLFEEKIDALAKAGVKGFIISIDAASTEAHETNRGLPGLCARIREANRLLSILKISSTASTTISRLVDFDFLPEFLSSLHFSSVTFSYPLRNLRSNYLGVSQSDIIRFETEELLEILERVEQVKKRFPVINPKASIAEMKRFLRGEEQRYPCLAGYKYFYLDWNLDLWRCYNWPKPMCSVRDFDGSQRIRDGCTECMIDCFRDSSVLHHIGISFSDACQALRHGRPDTALKAVFRRGNLGSIRSVLEDLRWIIRL